MPLRLNRRLNRRPERYLRAARAAVRAPEGVFFATWITSGGVTRIRLLQFVLNSGTGPRRGHWLVLILEALGRTNYWVTSQRRPATTGGAEG